MWTQYTSYFSDGEQCIFRINEPSFKGEDWIWDWREKAEISEQEKSYLKEFKSLVEKHEDFMLGMFGDHVKVTVDKHDITSSEHNHD